jgi:hypothetical protein
MQLTTNESIFQDMNLYKFRNRENKKIIFLLTIHNRHKGLAFSLPRVMILQIHLGFD